jgi:predicted phage tail protein
MTIKRTIKLYGSLAKKYGKEHTVNAETTFMLFRGLTHILGRGFKKHIADGKWTIHKNSKTTGKALSELQVHQELTDDVHTLHITPAIKGSHGGAAWLEIIVGAVLIYASWGTNPTGWAMVGMGLGMSLVMGGLTQLLAKSPTSGSSEQSYNFNGPVNNTEQGGPVPLIYGKVGNVGGTLISAGISYERI